MHILDASAIIHAWDNYPINQFPALWNWIAEQARKGDFCIARAAMEEVKHKTLDCARWLAGAGLAIVAESNEILVEAVRIKQLLGIRNDRFHPKGVDENDVIIIATAKVERLVLVSNESPQLISPQSRDRLKIPAVCNLPTVNVTCIDFLGLVKQSGTVF